MIGISLDIPEVACRGGRVSFPGFLPLVSGVPPTLFADFTTEGTTNNYWFNGNQQASLAAWNTAVGGTFARAGNATYFQGGVLKTATSGVIRFPSDNSSVSQGIRISGIGTNFVLQSNAFTTTWTLSSGAAPVQNVNGPDGGTNTGWTLTAAAGVGTALLQPVVISTPSQFSVFAKPGTSSFVYITTTDATGAKTTWFNVTTGAVGTTNATTSGAPTVVQSVPTTTQLANGWYWVGLRNAGTIADITIGQSDADNSTASTTGNTLLVFGAQGVSGAAGQGAAGQLDYIPTTTAAAGQIADVYQIAHTFGTTQSTVLVKFTANTVPLGIASIFSLNDTTTSNKMELWDSAAFPQTTLVSATSTQTSVAAIAFVNNATTKFAQAYQAGSQHLSINGAAVRTAAPASYLAAITRLAIGQQAAATTSAYTNIQQIAVWDGVFANDANLQALST